VGLPGPPRMSLANEMGLHPLLLNPMQPGSLAALPRLRMPVALRHPQQLASRQLMPSPLRTDGPGTFPAAPPDHVTGDSTSSAGNIMRGMTLGSVYRPMLEPQRASSLDGSGAAVGGGRGASGSASGGGAVGGPPGGQRGGSGSPLKPVSSVHQLSGATA
ncbi:hypothetical protein Vretifemale_4724, partial [Volvox reticuliferus]